jgi:hypothetical protein
VEGCSGNRATFYNIEKRIALEQGALEKWNQGNPSGYLDLQPMT